jgi:chemotaxis protein MotB
MRSKGVIAFGFLVVLTLTLATGCTTELRSLQGANQQLVAQREVLNQQIADLDAKLAEEKQGKAELEAQIRKLEADVDYWTGQAQAYNDAIARYKAIGVPGVGEQMMQGLAADMGGVYLEGGGIRLASDLLFDSGKTTLKSAAVTALQRAGEVFRSRDAEGMYLRIDGHTDSQPIKYSKWENNMELSQARSRAVWVELRKNGISPERMFTAGFGEFVPIDDNSTAEGRANNRRVEIWLVPRPGVVEVAE